jgi:hypothetical protein
VPLRALCECLGCKVNWIEDEWTVEIMLSNREELKYSSGKIIYLSNKNNAFHTENTRYKDDVIAFFWSNYTEYSILKDMVLGFNAQISIGTNNPTGKLQVRINSIVSPVDKDIFDFISVFWEKFDYLRLESRYFYHDLMKFETVSGEQAKGLFYTTLSNNEFNTIYRELVDYIEYVCEGWYYYVDKALV